MNFQELFIYLRRLDLSVMKDILEFTKHSFQLIVIFSFFSWFLFTWKFSDLVSQFEILPETLLLSLTFIWWALTRLFTSRLCSIESLVSASIAAVATASCRLCCNASRYCTENFSFQRRWKDREWKWIFHKFIFVRKHWNGHSGNKNQHHARKLNTLPCFPFFNFEQSNLVHCLHFSLVLASLAWSPNWPSPVATSASCYMSDVNIKSRLSFLEVWLGWRVQLVKSLLIYCLPSSVHVVFIAMP